MKNIPFIAFAFVVFSSFASAQTRAKFEPENGKVLHGAGLPNYWNDAELRAQYNAFKKYSGKKTAVVTWYASLYGEGRMTPWRQNYAMNLERVRKLGSVSLIKFSVQDYVFTRTKKIAKLKDISAGVYDAYFEEFAESVGEFRDPVFISLNHEMNGDWYPYSQEYSGSGVTSADYIASWRRIVDIFRKAGANNVAWVWSPNVPDVGAIPATKYYPGDEYVDWIGPSFYSGNSADALDSLYKIYSPRKPFFITEWATAQEKSRYYANYPGDAQWIAQFFKSLATKYPRVKAISWFQYDKEDGNHLLQRVSEQQQQYSEEASDARYSEDASGLVSKNGGVERVPTRVVPNEIILQEAPAARPRQSTPTKARSLRERINLESVKTESVRTQ